VRALQPWGISRCASSTPSITAANARIAASAQPSSDVTRQKTGAGIERRRRQHVDGFGGNHLFLSGTGHRPTLRRNHALATIILFLGCVNLYLGWYHRNMLEHTRPSTDAIASPGGRRQPAAMPPVITAEQIRMARALLRLSAAELGRRAGVAATTISRCETGSGVPQRVTVATLNKIREALEAEGVEFTGGNGPGVRLRRR
jgi:DNA-binding XRE family transcriptional regulator